MSTSKRDLPLVSYNSQLVVHYKNANHQVFVKTPYVPKKQYGKFLVLEDDLRELGIPPRDYAYTVVIMLKKWVMDHGMDTLPIKVFCGEWAMKKFLKVYESESVVIVDDDKDRLLYTELLIARAYIYANGKNGNVVRLGDIVEERKELLSPDWLELYYSGELRTCESEAIDMLCVEYNVRHANNYRDIVDALL